MKTLLLDNESGLYIQGLNKWTDDPEQAFDFKLADYAHKFIEIWGLKNAHLAFAFTEPYCAGRTAPRQLAASRGQR
jgi:hypothetical protein